MLARFMRIMTLTLAGGMGPAAWGEGVGANSPTDTQHTISLLTFIPETPILWGTIIGRDSRIGVELDAGGPVWTKHFEMDGPVLPMEGGTSFGIKERLTISGDRAWTGWEMLIPAIGIEVIFDRPHVALSGTTSVTVNGQLAPGLDMSALTAEPMAGTWLRYSFDPLPPGTQVDIIMLGLYTGQEPLGQPFTITQFPTPEPAGVGFLCAGLTLLSRRLSR